MENILDRILCMCCVKTYRILNSVCTAWAAKKGAARSSAHGNRTNDRRNIARDASRRRRRRKIRTSVMKVNCGLRGASYVYIWERR